MLGFTEVSYGFRLAEIKDRYLYAVYVDEP